MIDRLAGPKVADTAPEQGVHEAVAGSVHAVPLPGSSRYAANRTRSEE
jgi:hypothetical protein